MTATTVPTSTTETSTTDRPLLKTGAKAAVVAAVATTVVAAVASAAGVSFEIQGEAIPVLGFTQMTLLFSAVGIGIAALCRRFAASPRRAWVRVTTALVLLSFVPDLTADTDGASIAVLMLTHVVAARIVVPAIARQLPEHRTA